MLQIHVAKGYGYTAVLSAFFANDNNFRNFLFASLVNEALPKGVYS